MIYWPTFIRSCISNLYQMIKDQQHIESFVYFKYTQYKVCRALVPEETHHLFVVVKGILLCKNN